MGDTITRMAITSDWFYRERDILLNVKINVNYYFLKNNEQGRVNSESNSGDQQMA